MKTKLRRITVDGEKYLWRFGYAPRSVKYAHNGEGTSLLDVLAVYLPDIKSTSLRTFFKTWYYGPIGGPLHYEPTNMNSPKMVAEVIRYVRQHGWNLQENRGEYTIEDGVAILNSLGYNLEPDLWWEARKLYCASLQSKLGV